MIRDFLLWIEEHSIGILATIAIHLLIVSVILVLKIRTTLEQERYVIVDFSQIMEDIFEDPEEQQQQSVQDFQQEYNYNVRNIPVNVANERAVENIEKMLRDIMKEENITAIQPKNSSEEIAAKDDEKSELDAKTYDEQFPLNAQGERIIHKGPTTVSYELIGRQHMLIPYPGYKCQAGGKIVVDIVVNNNGYVISTAINKSRSDSEDPCLCREAIRDAERSRFNAAAQAQQKGSIIYIFQPQ